MFPRTMVSYETVSSEPFWLQDHYFPKFPAVGNLLVLDLSQELNDPIVLTLLSLQGIVNRDSPQIYLILDQYSAFWLQYAKTVMTLRTTQLSSASDLIARFTSRIKGVVVYDPSVPDTINVATTIAGLEDRLVVEPSSLSVIQGVLGSVDVLDLRNDVTRLGWSNSPSGRLSLYQWVYDNLWLKCDKRIIGVANPGAPVSSFGVALGVRDYIVALRLVTLYLSAEDPSEEALYRKFLSSAPSPIPVFGWVENQEDSTVSLVSSYGDWVAVISNVNNPSYPADLTVLGGLQVQPVRYTPRTGEGLVTRTITPGVYLTAYVTDGDNLGYDLSLGFGQWDGYQTGNTSVGWTINPTLVDIAPLVWNYYMASKRAATFVAGASGAGYVFPGRMSMVQLINYLSHAREYWQITGLRTTQVLDTAYEFGSDRAATPNVTEQLYAYELTPLGLFSGYNSLLRPNMLPYALGDPSDTFFYHDFGVTVAPNAYSLYGDLGWTESQVAENLLTIADGKQPVDAVTYTAANLLGFGMVVNDTTSTSGKVRVGHGSGESSFLTFGQYLTLPPGDYQVTFRLKSTNITAPLPLAVLDVADRIGHQILAQRTVLTTDLPQDSWQNMSLTFRLLNITDNVEFRVRFLSGSADLYVDTVKLLKLDGWQITGNSQPVFVVLSLITTSNPGKRAQFLEKLASLDPRIHLLNTDEFFTVVNTYIGHTSPCPTNITQAAGITQRTTALHGTGTLSHSASQITFTNSDGATKFLDVTATMSGVSTFWIAQMQPFQIPSSRTESDHRSNSLCN